jgi:hypothetical protein
MIPTADQLAQYFDGRRKNPIYDDAVTMYHDLRVHANGETPGDLIARRRPNESEEVHGYRLQIYEPITKQTFNSVLQSLGKIRRSRDWAIKYSRDYKFPLVPEGETLEEYCESKFPYYTSVTNWLFNVMLKSSLVDANCAVLVLPLQNNTGDNYKQPYPVIFYSDQVIEYLEGRFAILKSSEQVQIQNGNGITISDKFYLVTTNEVVPYVKQGDNWVALTAEITIHGLGYIPIIRPRCQFAKTVQEYNLFESRLAAMIPSLNEAIREYSDLQAAVVGHLFPERWEIATQECTSCGGTGSVPNPAYTGTDVKSKQLVCSSCNGLGATAGGGPYKKTVIRMPKLNLGEQAIPTPPFDYVKKDIAVIQVMEDRLDKHLYRGLSAINMQFLAQTPLSISGDAKAVDRDELNNFVYNVAEDIVYIADYLYTIIADYRYSYQYPNLTERRHMVPFIPVPEKFELLGPDDTMTTITQMRGNGIGGSLLTAMLKEFAKKQFFQEKDIAIPLLLEMDLDPFSGMSEADKAAMLATGNVLRRDYIRSAYVKDFVRRAVGENEGFADMLYEQQVAILDAYAEEVLNQLSVNSCQLPGNTDQVAGGRNEVAGNTTQPTVTSQPPTGLLPDNGIPPAAPLVNPDSLPNDQEEGNVGVE